MARTTLAQATERMQMAESENSRLALALMDAVTGEYDATATCQSGDERQTFKLSRARAGHGGILTIVSRIAGQRPTVSAVYAEPFLRPEAVARMPGWTWDALGRLRVARDQAVEKGR